MRSFFFFFFYLRDCVQADYYHVCEYVFHFLHLNTQAVLIFNIEFDEMV